MRLEKRENEKEDREKDPVFTGSKDDGQEKGPPKKQRTEIRVAEN